MDYLRAVRRRLGVVLSVVAVTVGLVVMFHRLQKPEYRASAVIRIGANGGSAAMLSGMGAGMALGLGGAENLLTQVNIMLSRSVAEEVVDAAGLRLQAVSPALSMGLFEQVHVDSAAPDETLRLFFSPEGVRVSGRAGEVRAPYGGVVRIDGVEFVVSNAPALDSATLAVVPRAAAVGALRQSLGAQQREKTTLVDLDYTAGDPYLAQRVVNAVAVVYKERTARLAREDARRGREFIEGQIRTTDSLLIDAQAALSTFRRNETVFSSRDKFAAEQSGLMNLDVKREELSADRRMFQRLLEGLQQPQRQQARAEIRTVLSAPNLASNPVIANLANQLFQYETVRDSALSGPWASSTNNPDVQRVDAMISTTESKLISAVGSHIAALDAKLASIDDLRRRSENQMKGMPEPEAEEVRLMQHVEIVRAMEDQLRQEYQRARITEAVQSGTVELVDLADVPGPVGDRLPLKLAFGLLVGLLLGGAGAVALENANTSIHRRGDVESALGLPDLAVIPPFASGHRAGAAGSRLRLPIRMPTRRLSAGTKTEEELVSVRDPRSPAAEAYRNLRTNLIFSQAAGDLGCLVVTSSAPSEGKSSTAANLAVTFAQQGVRVLLVDCDLRKARLHRLFDVPREPGLSQLVLGHADAAAVVRPTRIDGLSVLPAGTLPPNPAEVVGGLQMKRTLDALREEFDLVVLDTPPLLAASDAAILGRLADGVLLVVRAGRTERAAVRQAMQMLHGVGARVVGVVLNDPDAKLGQSGDYYAFEYYGVEA